MQNEITSGSNSHAVTDVRRRWPKLALLLTLVCLAMLLGHDLVRHVTTLEQWIAGNGWLGIIVFVGAVMIFTSIFVPDTVFALIAGMLFGVSGGTLLMTVAALCTAALDFALARYFLQGMVNKALQGRPALAAIQDSVRSEGLRFQLLLRLTPLNPVGVSYVLGASNTPFPSFLIGCSAMVPILAVEVYFGHTAHHVAKLAAGTSQASTLHTVATIAGLVLCVTIMLYLTHIAKAALAKSQPN